VTSLFYLINHLAI